jgi:hypothetical protein
MRPLSPWKGGGFGMFSTVDAPSARFVRLYLVNDEEQIPVIPPKALATEIGMLRTLPDQGRLHRLASTIASRTWVDYRLSSAARHYRDLLAELAVWPDGLFPDAQRGGLLAELNRSLVTDPEIDFGKLRLVRPLEENEPLPAASRIVPVKQVRAEVWRYRFDGSTARLRAHKLVETTAGARP